MATEITPKEEVKKIFSQNPDLKERMKHWSTAYNKGADMIASGEKYPVGSFYTSIGEGIMLRIDKNGRIYGFAIENVKDFIKQNPNPLGLSLSIYVYPVRSFLVTLPMLFFAYQTPKIIKQANAMFVSDYIVARTV